MSTAAVLLVKDEWLSEMMSTLPYMTRLPNNMPAAERVRVMSVEGPVPLYRPDLGPCSLWSGYIRPDGYGHLSFQGKTVKAHRIAYEGAHGPIPENWTIDHLCRVRACVNPAHLEAVTTAVNILRGEGPPAQNARKATCSNGHEFTDDNTYVYPDGRRQCRVCRRNYIRGYMRKRRANA